MIYGKRKAWIVISDANGVPEFGMELPAVDRIEVERNMDDVTRWDGLSMTYAPGRYTTITIRNDGPWFTRFPTENGWKEKDPKGAIEPPSKEITN